MLYEEMEKKEIERVYAVFADYIREKPLSGMVLV